MAGGNIKVVVRVRPFNGRELDRHAKCVVQMKDDQTILLPPPDAEERLRSTKAGKVGDGQKVFAFDKSYWSFNRQDANFAGQDDLFKDLGAPLLDNAFKGYNNCIFAYGQTGSGKSYSMMGYGEEAGVIPRICEDMFRRITETQNDQNLTYTVEVSYLEIYNERVRDLLNPATKGNLKVREHPSTGPYVEDLAKLVVRSFQEIQHLMDEGNKARTVAATSMNETSSRSHAVFTLTVTQKRHDVETQMDTERVAKISLVDLAGSERATSTGATGARLKEGAEINRSLSTLGRVIAALADLSTGKKRNVSMVPYRDSVLTWLLKDSLGGNSMTAMIAAISPADINFEETLSTLRYANSAKRIKNHAVINEDPNARMIRELKEELAQLRSKLNSSATPGGLAQEGYPPGTPLDQQIVSITQADGTVKKVSKAEIAEQLSQSEKLYEDLNQTWEEKLQKTQQIHREREAALEELGISIEKGFVGLSTPKKMPHLVNLSDDPLLAECLVYNIKPGKTSVGNVEDSTTTSEIRLNGTKILREHCTFENADHQVTIIPNDGAAVMVNGVRIEAPTRLRSGNRIILGDFHIFRFNHPMEARAERKEQSLLRHTVTTYQLGSPGPRGGHSRALSRADSEIDGYPSRPESPMPGRFGRDSDWSYARREAAGAMLGVDQKIANLTEEELDSLFDDVQRERAVRKGRPESRLFGQDEEDAESLGSYPIREKYMSNGTIENFSSDTVLTFPSTPSQASEEGESETSYEETRLQTVRTDTGCQLRIPEEDEEREQQTPAADSTLSHEVEELKAEKERMEMALLTAQQELHAQLTEQKAAFARELEQVSKALAPRITQDGFVDLLEEEIAKVRKFAERWRQVKYVRLAEIVLQHAATLKEAQVRSQAMDKQMFFQFTVVGQGHEMCSSYDLVLSDISGDEDPALDDVSRPCIAVRVLDYEHNVIHLWSTEKLEQRVQAMRQMHQYLDRPGYTQHFRPENPFLEPCLPRFSLVGEVDVPLATVFEARVHDYTLDVLSIYTYETIGIIKLSLEPSSAYAPPSMLKFNVVMHDLVGLAEREVTEVHAQMFIPGVSGEGGATTTQIIADFDEDPIRFESVHSMTLPAKSPRNISLRVAIYAKVHPMHLDKLLSWDHLRESNTTSLERGRQRVGARIAETEYHVQEQHDVFAKLKIAELAESGEYLTVEVEQSSIIDSGTYQLHQGLQRRIFFNLTYSSTESMKWKEVKSLRVGHLRLLNVDSPLPPQGHDGVEFALKLVQEPSIIESADGTKEVTAIGQWDSSLHGSSLLDRPTAEKYLVAMAVSIEIVSMGIDTPMTFTVDQKLQIRPRSWLRPQALFKQLWKSSRITHSTSSIFSVVLKPASEKRATDIWRMNSQNGYVKGEETLSNWTPRGVWLIQDFAQYQQHRQQASDVEATRVYLRCHEPPSLVQPPEQTDQLTDRQRTLIAKCVSLWTTSSPKAPIPQNRPFTPSPPSSLPSQSTPPRPRLSPTVISIPKNPTVVKSSYILSPSLSSLRWQRHFAELRPPYLHIYAVPSGDETAIINLCNARIDQDPPVQRLLQSDRVAKNVFAVYAPMRSWLFAARSELQKREWILAIDDAFTGDKG